jgi:hypothetical protein
MSAAKIAASLRSTGGADTACSSATEYIEAERERGKSMSDKLARLKAVGINKPVGRRQSGRTAARHPGSPLLGPRANGCFGATPVEQ